MKNRNKSRSDSAQAKEYIGIESFARALHRPVRGAAANIPVERTARSPGSVPAPGPVPVGRRSPRALSATLNIASSG